MREEVDRFTNSAKVPDAAGPSRVLGPTLPSAGRGPVGPAWPPSTMFSANHTDRQLALENAQEDRQRERKAERNAMYSRAEELVPKSGGREGKMEERRATNAVNKQFRERDMGEGLEVSESTLLGSDGGFAAA